MPKRLTRDSSRLPGRLVPPGPSSGGLAPRLRIEATFSL